MDNFDNNHSNEPKGAVSKSTRIMQVILFIIFFAAIIFGGLNYFYSGDQPADEQPEQQTHQEKPF